MDSGSLGWPHTHCEAEGGLEHPRSLFPRVMASCGSEAVTQGFTHARQVLYQLHLQLFEGLLNYLLYWNNNSCVKLMYYS